jgi:RNA polymerase primary sigma factor
MEASECWCMKDTTSIQQRYFNDIDKTPLLTREEEINLAKGVQRGDSNARDKMIRANLKLVVKIANDYKGCGLDVDDMVAEGNIGLMKAVDRFDPGYGAKFSTYAGWWIRQKILRALSNQTRTVRLPVHVVDKIRKLRAAEFEFEGRTGRPPSDHEIGKETGLDRKQLRLVRESGQALLSLDAPEYDDGSGVTLHERIDDSFASNPFDTLSDEGLRNELPALLDVLDVRERDIIVKRYGLDGKRPLTLEEVGQHHHITRERIRQLQVIATKKMQSALRKRETWLPEILRN